MTAPSLVSTISTGASSAEPAATLLWELSHLLKALAVGRSADGRAATIESWGDDAHLYIEGIDSAGLPGLDLCVAEGRIFLRIERPDVAYEGHADPDDLEPALTWALDLEPALAR